MSFLRQATSQVARFGKFVDATDGVTAETGLTIANTDILLSKDGGAFAAKNSGGATHDSAGWYSATFDATDTATVGILEVDVSVAGALPVFMRFYVVEEAIYDALFAASATGLLPANITQLGGDTQSLTDLKDFADAGYDPATNQVNGVKLVDTTTANSDMIDGGDIRTAIGLGGPDLGDQLTDLDTAIGVVPTAAENRAEMDSNSTQLAAILVDTGTTIPASLTALDGKVDTIDGIADAILIDTGTTIPATLTTIDGIVDDILLDTGTTLPATLGTPTDTDLATDISNISAGSAPTASQVADAVWDEAQSGHTTAGTFGAYLDSAISGINVGSGSGARTVTITVDDGSTALQNATVRMTEGVNTFTALTNVSGVATFNLDDATYTVAITKGGYSYAGTTLVVNGTEAETYSMTAISPTASSAGFSTGYGYAYSEAGDLEAGVAVYAQLVTAPTGTGDVYDQKVRTATTDANGLYEFTGMARGGVYRVWRGVSRNRLSVTVPDAASFAITNFVGIDE